MANFGAANIQTPTQGWSLPRPKTKFKRPKVASFASLSLTSFAWATSTNQFDHAKSRSTMWHGDKWSEDCTLSVHTA